MTESFSYKDGVHKNCFPESFLEILRKAYACSSLGLFVFNKNIEGWRVWNKMKSEKIKNKKIRQQGHRNIKTNQT